MEQSASILLPGTELVWSGAWQATRPALCERSTSPGLCTDTAARRTGLGMHPELDTGVQVVIRNV